MNRQVSDDTESRFAAYVQALTSGIGHPDRSEPLKDYCVGLLAAEGRKSVEPMAAVLLDEHALVVAPQGSTGPGLCGAGCRCDQNTLCE